MASLMSNKLIRTFVNIGALYVNDTVPGKIYSMSMLHVSGTPGEKSEKLWWNPQMTFYSIYMRNFYSALDNNSNLYTLFNQFVGYNAHAVM